MKMTTHRHFYCAALALVRVTAFMGGQVRRQVSFNAFIIPSSGIFNSKFVTGAIGAVPAYFVFRRIIFMLHPLLPALSVMRT